jgi:pimeloyl-ACP methyl ester carboxylesterase
MIREALRAGPEGYAWDLALATRPWGFPLEDIRIPVHIWHGELDVTTPIAMGRYLAAVIPGARARFLPNAGHFVSHAIWPELLAATRAALAG